MDTVDIVVLCVSGGLAGWLIYAMDNGLRVKRQLYFLIIPVIEIIVFSFFNTQSSFKAFDYAMLTTPIGVVGVYNLLNLWSWKMHDREFRLKMRNARNMGRQDMYKLSDSIFSFIVIIVWMFWSIIILLIAMGGKLLIMKIKGH
jgi:hypothetical protein